MRKKLTKEMIDSAFEKAHFPEEYVIKLYQIVIDDWDNVIEINDWPSVNEKTDEYLWNKVMEFDSKFKEQDEYKNYLVGSVWMNKGFNMKPDINDWEVEYDETKIIRKEVK